MIAREAVVCVCCDGFDGDCACASRVHRVCIACAFVRSDEDRHSQLPFGPKLQAMRSGVVNGDDVLSNPSVALSCPGIVERQRLRMFVCSPSPGHSLACIRVHPTVGRHEGRRPETRSARDGDATAQRGAGARGGTRQTDSEEGRARTTVTVGDSVFHMALPLQSDS